MISSQASIAVLASTCGALVERLIIALVLVGIQDKGQIVSPSQRHVPTANEHPVRVCQY